MDDVGSPTASVPCRLGGEASDELEGEEREHSVERARARSRLRRHRPQDLLLRPSPRHTTATMSSPAPWVDQGDVLSLSSIREALIPTLSLRPVRPGPRIAIVREAESLNVHAPRMRCSRFSKNRRATP